MPYVPNASDPTQPTEDKAVESAALEFRTLKTAITDGVQWPSGESATYRDRLPGYASRGGKVLAFDAVTAKPVVGPTVTEIANAQGYAVAADASADDAAASAIAASASAAAAAASAASVDAANLLTKSGNLSGLANPSAARSNLGLGPVAQYSILQASRLPRSLVQSQLAGLASYEFFQGTLYAQSPIRTRLHVRGLSTTATADIRLQLYDADTATWRTTGYLGGIVGLNAAPTYTANSNGIFIAAGLAAASTIELVAEIEAMYMSGTGQVSVVVTAFPQLNTTANYFVQAKMTVSNTSALFPTPYWRLITTAGTFDAGEICVENMSC